MHKKNRSEFAVLGMIADGAAGLELERRILPGALFPLCGGMWGYFEDLSGWERLSRPINKHLPVGNHGVDEGSATPGRGSPIPMLSIPGEPVRAARDGPCQDDGVSVSLVRRK